jgi:hypothetical protein
MCWRPAPEKQSSMERLLARRRKSTRAASPGDGNQFEPEKMRVMGSRN